MLFRNTDRAWGATRTAIALCVMAVGGFYFLWACGRPKVTLPPVGSASDTAPVAVEPGMPNATEPGLPALVAAYIRGERAAAYRNGARVACFLDLGPPCAGTVVDSLGQVRTIKTSDVCAYSNPTGKAHLVIADAEFKAFFDISFSLPETFTSIPTEIGDETSKLVLDENCSL